jgi:PAS domain S-box-containing protein
MDGWRQLTVFATPDSWLWETDQEHRFVWMSETVEKIIGVEREWHYGKSRMEIKSPGVTAEFWAEHVRALENREPFRDFTFKRVGVDREKWISSSGIPLFDADGEFTGYRGIARDLTSEIEAREHASLLAGVINEVKDTISIYDQDDRLVYFNTAFATLNAGLGDLLKLGTSYERIMRECVAIGLFPESTRDTDAWIKWSLEHHRDPREPVDIRRRNGRILEFKAQQLANGSQNRFQGFAEACSDFLWETDANHNYIFFSESFQALAGLDPADLLGKNRRSIIKNLASTWWCLESGGNWIAA